MNCRELNVKLDTIKKNKNSLVLSLLEDLEIDYNVLDSEEYGYFRVRVIIDSDLKGYCFTDIWYSKYDNGWKAVDYWKEV